jgi:PAS domain S-box-containing protein
MAKILIVEDDPASRDYLRTLLTATNHKVVEASDGKEGLKSAHEEHPDLVITDILMPTMDGFEFVRQLRKDPKLANTRVVFCSATYLQRETEALAKSCGVTNTLVKPAEPQEVNRIVQKALGESQAATAPLEEEFHLQHVGIVGDLAVRKSAELQIANERLSALIVVGNQLASEPDVKKLIEKFCKGARYVLAGRYTAVALFQEDEKKMELVSTSGLPTRTHLNPIFDSLAQAVMKELRPTKSTARVYDESVLSFFKNDLAPEPAQGCLGSAIAFGKQLYGLLLVIGKVGGKDFTAEDEQVAGTLAAQMAVAYENALRVDRLRKEISERKRAEEALRHSESRNRELIENAAYGIFRSNEPGRFLSANPSMVRMLGYESAAEILHLNLSDDVFRYPTERERLLEQLKKEGHIHGIESQWKKKDGTHILVRLSGRLLRREPSEFEGIAEDITNFRALEKHNRELQKFEAIGQLAGGVAHDFNNVIGAILGWAELGKPEANPGSKLQTYLERIRSQAERAGGLTKQLLAFARRQILEPRNINMNQAVKDVMGLLKPVIGEHIEIKLALAEGIEMTRVDPTQLEQVIMNLCLNARDAMPNGGELLIETSNVEFDDEYCRQYTYARPGPFVLLSISDTGEGMDKATIDRIFEPFFTTKEMGKGTGLGLATVYGIVRQHGGLIHVYSEPRRGSTFRVYLPKATGDYQPSGTKEQTEPVRGGTETILVAEDHEGNREIATAILEKLGYTILSAADGEEAVRVFESNSDRIALVLMDVLMPKLAGPDALARMRKRKPGLPALFTTGYSTELTHLELLTKQGAQILQKPYSSASLGLKVRQILNRRRD